MRTRSGAGGSGGAPGGVTVVKGCGSILGAQECLWVPWCPPSTASCSIHRDDPARAAPKDLHPSTCPTRDGVWGAVPQNSSLGADVSREVPGAPHSMGSAPLWGSIHTPQIGNLLGTVEPFSHAVGGQNREWWHCRVCSGPCPHPCHTKAVAVSRHFPPPAPLPPLLLPSPSSSPAAG